jgi:hypothetical protein
MVRNDIRNNVEVGHSFPRPLPPATDPTAAPNRLQAPSLTCLASMPPPLRLCLWPQRIRKRQRTDPGRFGLLYPIVLDEVERRDHNHSQSCTKAVLWLKRWVGPHA